MFKQSNANITQTADAVLPQVEKINAELPPGFTLELVIDQSRSVRETVDEVQHELVLASLSRASCCSSSCTASAARSS